LIINEQGKLEETVTKVCAIMDAKRLEIDKWSYCKDKITDV
jgi:hypothetical protein